MPIKQVSQIRDLIGLGPYQLLLSLSLSVIWMFLNRRHYLLFVVNGAKVKSTTVDDLFLGVPRQNELSSCFTALKKYPLGLVCLHRVCFFFRQSKINSLPFTTN